MPAPHVLFPQQGSPGIPQAMHRLPPHTVLPWVQVPPQHAFPALPQLAQAPFAHAPKLPPQD